MNNNNGADSTEHYTKNGQKYEQTNSDKVKELLQQFISGPDGYIYDHGADRMMKGDIVIDDTTPVDVDVDVKKSYVERFIRLAMDKYDEIKEEDGEDAACEFIHNLYEYIVADDADFINLYYFDNIHIITEN